MVMAFRIGEEIVAGELKCPVFVSIISFLLAWFYKICQFGDQFH